MADPDPQNEPFAAPYVLNQSSVVLNGETSWPMSSPPPPPPGPPRRPWVTAVVLVAAVGLVVGLIAGGAAEFQALSQRAATSVENNDNPLIGVPDAPSGSDDVPTDQPAPIVAVCPPMCFTVASAGLMVPDGSLQISMPISGLPLSPEFQHPTTAAAEYRADVTAWAAHSPNPLVCFFADSRSPVSPALGGPDSTADDPVTFLGESTDDSQGSSMTQSARFFASSNSATDYMRRLEKQIELCHLVDPAVDSAANFDLPAGIDVATAVDTTASTTTYIYDFQRANVVVRFRVVSSDHVDEDAVRHFLGTWVTTNLDQLEVR